MARPDYKATNLKFNRMSTCHLTTGHDLCQGDAKVPDLGFGKSMVMRDRC